MPSAPVNVFLDSPSISIEGWETQKDHWSRLNEEVGGNPAFTPLTVKAFYVFGVLLSIFRSVEILLDEKNLQSTTYLPAYALFASGVELLGRCLEGNPGTTKSPNDLRAGFQWLCDSQYHSYSNLSDTTNVVETGNGHYTIDDLSVLRNYTAHGQAALPKEPPPLDYLILEEMPSIIASSLESYWDQLQRTPGPCNALAKANIYPFRNRPVLDTLWVFSRERDGQYLALGDIFGELDWSYNYPVIGGGSSG